MTLPRTFYITLTQTPDREKRMRDHCAANSIEAEPFYGIHAIEMGLRTVIPYEVDYPGSNYFIDPKHVGMVLSHLMLWRALTLQPQDEFLILEDDAQFENGWQSGYDSARKDLPDNWDMLFIGSANCADKDKETVGRNLFLVKYPFATHSYIVRKKSLITLIDTQRKVYAPIDLALGFHSFPKLVVLTVLPPLTSQVGTFLNP